MKQTTLNQIRTFIMGLGIINILFGFTASAYSQLLGNIFLVSGIIFIGSFFVILIYQLPDKPNQPEKYRSQ